MDRGKNFTRKIEGQNRLTMPPAIPETNNPKIQVGLLKKENNLLRREIKRLNQALGSKVLVESDIKRIKESAMDIQYELELKYNQTIEISEHYDMLIKESQNQKEVLRELLDQKISEIGVDLKKVVTVFEDCTKHLKNQNFKVLKQKVNGHVSQMNDKLLQFETVISDSQGAYRSRLEKILETRRQAEVNFLEERRKFVLIVKDLEKAYSKRQEEFKERLKREYDVIEDSYFKLKNENGKKIF